LDFPARLGKLGALSLKVVYALKILIAPNAFKGSLTASEAAQAIELGVKQACPQAQTVLLPIADGGDGCGAILAAVLAATTIRLEARGPLGRPQQTQLYFHADQRTAIIESADVIGLRLISGEPANPLLAGSYGLGQLILKALDLKAEQILIGLGGSATNDAGMGMAEALGVRFLNAQGIVLSGSGAALETVWHIDTSGMDPRLRHTDIRVMCDVDNPLYGPTGAAHMFAAQKGADPAQVSRLDEGLKNFAERIHQEMGLDVSCAKGAGAAGGLGAGLMAFCQAVLQSGTELIFDLIELDKQLQLCELVITAEGCLDAQSGCGKGPVAVAKRASDFGVPCIVVAGKVTLDPPALQALGFDKVTSICNQTVDMHQSMQDAASYLQQASRELLQQFVGYSEPSK